MTDTPTAGVNPGNMIISIGTFIWLWAETGNHWVGGGLLLTGILANYWAQHRQRKIDQKVRETLDRLVENLDGRAI